MSGQEDQPRAPLASFTASIAGLTRLGLSRASLEAAIAAELDEGGFKDSALVARAVADAMDTNNEEILRQLRQALA